MLTRNANRERKSLVTETITKKSLPLETCRICLKRGKIPIFGKDDKSEDVKEFGGIEISYGDDLPQYLCLACLSLLDCAILFRQTAKNSVLKLKVGKKSSDFTQDTSDFSDNDVPDNFNDTDNESIIKREYLEFKDSSDSENELKLKCEPQKKTNIINSNAETQRTTDEKSNKNQLVKEKARESKDSNESFIEEEYLEFKDSSGSETEHDLSRKIIYEPESDSASKNVVDTLVTTSEGDVDMPLLKTNENTDVDNEMVMIIVSEKNCEICNITLENQQALEKHNTEKHPVIPPNHKKCEICHKPVNKKSYKSHIEQHREKYKKLYDKKYGKVECEVCGKQVSKSYHKIHMKIHGTAEEQAERYVDCTICKKSFSAHYFSDHMNRVHDNPNIKPKRKSNNKQSKMKILMLCPICDKNVNEDIYKEHLARHGGSTKKYICDKCGKVFKHPSAFQTHKLTHGSELKYKCQFCPYRGLHLALLKIHVRTHTGDYNYKCSECPARFTTKSNLTKHCQRHQGLCKYKCDICNKGFYNKRDVDKHIKNVHLALKNHICEMCGKGFGHRDNMLAHQIKVHNRKRITDKKGRVASYIKEDQMKSQESE